MDNYSIQGVSAAGASSAMSSASAPAAPNTKMSNLFSQIDTSGSGTITEAQFDKAFQSMNPPGSVKAAGADAIWKQLDPNGTGSVSKQDFVSGMTSALKQLRGGHHHHGGSSSAGAQQVSQSTSSLDAIGGAGSSSTSGVGSTLSAQA